jgi:hypothetical protein
MATFKVSTKADKDASPVETKLTINFDGCSEEVLREIATSAIVVKWQGQIRKNGIPSEAEISAVNYRPGTRMVQQITVEGVLASVTKMSAEERAKLRALLEDSEEQE